LRSHGCCQVLVNLMRDGAPGATECLQTVSHLITNLMRRNNTNSLFFASQINLSGYFLGIEKGIRALDPPLVSGLSSIICRIYSKRLALYAMYHPEADIDLAGESSGGSNLCIDDGTAGHPSPLPSPLLYLLLSHSSTSGVNRRQDSYPVSLVSAH
jgi:hypothetical protein